MQYINFDIAFELGQTTIAAAQMQTAVTAHLKSEQLLLFVFALQIRLCEAYLVFYIGAGVGDVQPLLFILAVLQALTYGGRKSTVRQIVI